MGRRSLTQRAVLQRLGELAFGRANDVVKLALLEEGALLGQLDGLDLSVLAEFKRGDRGVEIKVVDRVQALEELFKLLGGGERRQAEAFFRALEGGENRTDEGSSPAGTDGACG